MYKGIRAGIKGMVRFHTRHILTLHLFDDFARNQHTACLAANAARAGAYDCIRENNLPG